MTGTPGRRSGEAGTCRDCSSPIVWAWTARKGHRLPLEPEGAADDPAATIAVRRDAIGRLLARPITEDYRLAGFERARVPHRAVCPPLVAERERRASLRRARATAPHPADTEALHEARVAAQQVATGGAS